MSGVVTATAIGVGGAMYSASQARSAQKEAIRAQQEAQRKAEEEARRIAMERRPDEIGATLQIGGSTTVGSTKGSTADFLVPKQSALGSSGSSGLGFKV